MIKLINSKFFKTVLPNIAIILSCMMLTLTILDYYNPLMGFLSRGMSVGVIAIWIAVLVLYVLTLTIRIVYKNKTKDMLETE